MDAARNENTCRPATDNMAGFTLTETMVVLVVTAILLAIGTPNFLNIKQRDSVETAAYDLQRTVAMTRQKALAKRLPHRLVINPISRTYYVQRKEAGTWVFEGPDTLEWCSQVEMTLNAGGDPTNYDIEINPQGSVESTDSPASFTFWVAPGPP